MFQQSSALLLGCKLSQLWKFRQAREERRKWAEYHLSQRSLDTTSTEPLSFASFITDSNSSSRKVVETEATASKNEFEQNNVEVSVSQDPVEADNPKTPAAWAASEFPSIWGKPLTIHSKWIKKVKKQALQVIWCAFS